ncbi:CcoQ/FixQ family Cbb3-type cytochrome c oxidase assembly chaperone [Apibacter adventoris]|uniref:CcoQ/FixQ family Cbb3-type cytochrome c oxidase assembly chaperone n=1 Tax=Apibacter adventoris TaxID=1679466 RepID=A0A2S8AGQ9_9FLAO|nr:CcoQ/FixQ family Cbb3-type cytochrome c oxidase assembly chaperone [Apibacter adventoris]PQL92559.1 CcoQ/FixQ family Cbb3-type cytochrome c oxidase assembly chaperone [Apibacter adventoris]PQL95564.1 CcoQ/FixQ family Cbb3-type cytochrome c oxidase assembly chaperone [Apibacter adventoris]
MLKFYNKIVAGVDNATIYQSIALLLFFLFFLFLIIVVVKKPKKYYHDMSNLPLDEPDEDTNLNNTN